MGVKMAIVGGGSTYTPELVEGLCDHEDRLAVDELVLLDPDPDRLGPVAGLSQRILRHRGWTGRLEATGDRQRGPRRRRLRGGPAAGRRPGGSALGRDPAPRLRLPGAGDDRARRIGQGAADGARSCSGWPRRRRAGRRPGAWLVDFTNPVGIVTQALADEGHRAVGLCNVARTVQRRVGHYLGGVDPDAIDLEHVGLNHLTWVRTATVDGVDRLPGLLERFGPELELESGTPIDLISLLGALPSYYLHYYYGRDAELAEQVAPGYRPRAEVVAELEAKLLVEYEDPGLVTKPELLSWRGGAYYSEAAVRLMASLHAGTGDVQVVDVRNTGRCPWPRRRRRGRGAVGGRRRGGPPTAPAAARPPRCSAWSST